MQTKKIHHFSERKVESSIRTQVKDRDNAVLAGIKVNKESEGVRKKIRNGRIVGK